MSKPNFFLVGAPRCGTTSMYTYLKQHPDIYLSLIKEPLFFCRDLTAPAFAVTDPDSYRSLFSDAGSASAVGEGSVWYLMSRIAARAIVDDAPDARIIVMLRRPIDMMSSLHALYLRTGNEDIEDFAEALAAQSARQRGQRLPPGVYFPEGLQYLQVARYADQVERYLNAVGRERVHCVLFDDFARDPARAYRDTLAFLGVDSGFVAEFEPARATARVRAAVLRQIRLATPEIRSKIKRADDHAGPRTGPVSSEVKGWVAEALADDVARLGQLIDRDLSHWSEHG